MNNNHSLTPLLIPLVGLIVGIAVQAHLSCPYWAAAVLLATSALLLITQYNKPRPSILLLLVLFFSAGSLQFHFQHDIHEQTLKTIRNKPVTVAGVIIDKHDVVTKKHQQLITLNVSHVSCHEYTHHLPLSFTIHCYLSKHWNVAVGDTISLGPLTIKKPATTSLSNNPSFNDYLVKEGLLTTIFTNRTVKIQLIKRPSWSLKRYICTIKYTMQHRLSQKLSSQAARYFSLIFLGSKQIKHACKLRMLFGTWGLSHFLARSGLHIIFFIFLCTFLLRFIPIHISIKKVLLLLLCFIYLIFSWASVPFIRAYTIFFLAQGGFFCLRNINFHHLFMMTSLMVLLYNPMLLFFLDFQLSYGLTFALAFFMPPITKKAFK